ncbi:MAG: ABC-F family ATP-binding cassette domain-containing protein [Spirochaetaceae bacterium]|nr:ABC-F family ATP-binding cassette domain-containing protein [Spirochaetaceae bacterium]
MAAVFVQLSGVSLAFGGRPILVEANLNLSAGTRCALTGANGSGKTTLMRIIAEEIAADSGSVTRGKTTRISYLPQSGIVHAYSDDAERQAARPESGATERRSLREEAELAFEPLRAYLAEIEDIEKALSHVTPESPETARLLETLHHHREHVENSGYWSRGERIGSVLRGLGFSAGDLDRDAGEFSGGWQMRIALAKVLLEDPDILLLDEPTNYLDLEARAWLAKFLASFAGGVLLVSHDRWFLDETVREVAEIFCARLTRYTGNYTAYEKRRQEEVASLKEAWRQQQEEIARQEEFIRRFRYNASKAAMVQSRLKQLEKLVRVEVPESMKRIHFSFPPAPRSGRWVIKAEGISKSYGGRGVLEDVSFELARGEKLVVAGANGAGKSTLLRILAGEDASYSGRVELGAGTRPAYFAQDGELAPDEGRSVEEEIESVCPTALFPKIRSMLGAFLFRGDDVSKPVAVLSGGERSRLALLKLLLVPANLLILDEPTNHLDMNSKDVLLDALRDFEGTVVFVSHDRYFIEALATRVLELRAGEKARFFPGDYAYYLSRAAAEDGTALRSAPPAAARPVPSPERGEQKQRKTLLRRLLREEEELLAGIAGREKERTEIQAAMARPEAYADGAKMKNLKDRLSRAAEEEAKLQAAWEEASRRIDALRSEEG